MCLASSNSFSREKSQAKILYRILMKNITILKIIVVT